MNHISGAGISTMLSFALGAGLAGYAMTNYETSTPTQTVKTVDSTSSPSQTPTYEMTPSGVATSIEGDDGSLGGPVYNEAHPTTPVYVYATPNDVTESPITDPVPTDTPTDAPTGVGSPDPAEHPAPPQNPPHPTQTPSPDEHTPSESPSDTSTPAG